MIKQTALITGATSGIGAAFAKKFASQNFDLIITGRQEDKIQALAKNLLEKFNISVEVMILELANDHDLNLLIDKVKDHKNLKILVNNAGFGDIRDFADSDLTFCENMIKVHCLATMKLTHAALPNMIASNSGTIINVSSVGAFYPFYKSSVYVGTKAFISMLTETIAMELKGTNIRIQDLCPGMTDTDFFAKIGVDISTRTKKGNVRVQTPEEVVDSSLRCLKKNKVLCIPGYYNIFMVLRRSLRRFFV